MIGRTWFRPEAEAELAGAILWYEERGKGLGAEFLRAVEATVAAIERQPEAYAFVSGKARRAVLRRFPYSLIYTFEANEILVVACFHGKRDPKRWQERR